MRIDRIELIAYSWPRLELEIDCGGGTYIRSMARDVGEALGCGGLVEVLVRTRIGPFTVDRAMDPTILTPDSLQRLSSLSARGGPRLAPDRARSIAGRGRHPRPRRPDVSSRQLLPVAGEIALSAPDGTSDRDRRGRYPGEDRPAEEGAL